MWSHNDRSVSNYSSQKSDWFDCSTKQSGHEFRLHHRQNRQWTAWLVAVDDIVANIVDDDAAVGDDWAVDGGDENDEMRRKDY